MKKKSTKVKSSTTLIVEGLSPINIKKGDKVCIKISGYQIDEINFFSLTSDKMKK